MFTSRKSLTPSNAHVQRILSKFRGNGNDLVIKREYGSVDSYTLIQHLGGDRYLSLPLEPSEGTSTIAIDGDFMRLCKVYVNNIYAAFTDQTTPAISLTGTWTTATNVDTYGKTGRLMFSGTTNDYIEFQTENGATSVGAIFRTGISGGGIALVSIDGDNTLANLLLTAQDLVNAGTLPSTVLVANGGTLNPTDRVLDTKGNTANNGNLFNSSLSDGTHTIRITVTGYKTTASTNTYLFIHGIIAYGVGLYDTNEAIFLLWPIAGIATVESYPVWEISWNIIPTGASSAGWVGHTGSLKFLQLPTITVDGASTTLSKGQKSSGQSIIITMQFNVRHTQTGTTNLGICDFSYTFNSITGLTIEHSLEWLVAGSLSLGYPCMMTLDTNFDRCKSVDTSVASLDDNDSSKKSNTRSPILWAWDYDGNLGAMMYMPSLQKNVNRWLTAGVNQLFMHDDNAGVWNKMRAIRFGVNTNYNIGDIWQSKTNYRIKWFDNGANTSLAI